MSIKQILPLTASVLLLLAAVAHSEESLEKRASWTLPAKPQVQEQLNTHLAAVGAPEETKLSIDELWAGVQDQPSGVELLEVLADSLATADTAVREVVVFCRQEQPAAVATFDILDAEETPPLVGNNLKLLYGRWLAQHEYYDESLALIGKLNPEDVVDPASLLFYQGVGHQRLLDKDPCLSALDKLLENEGEIPQRYETVAQLMQADLKPLKTDSLNEVSRLMDDIERRLGFGRAGTKVRKKEDDVVAKLDKMIEEMEKQQSSSSSGSAGGSNPSSPMQDSMPGGGSGPGNVEQRNVGSRSDWGNLPPKQRQEALQQIAKGLPSHYREVIEEYFRKLARDGND